MDSREHVEVLGGSSRMAEAMSDATLKLLFEGERMCSRALNRDYPEPIRLVTEHDRICGVVVFSGRYR